MQLLKQIIDFFMKIIDFFNQKKKDEQKRKRLEELQQVINNKNETQKQLDKGKIDELNKKFGYNK